jgi:hypothetical protein
MLIKCSNCGERISIGWLVLGMPWSKYTCTRCGSVLAGTLARLIAVSISTGILGYVLIGVIKGKIDVLLLPLPLLLALAVLFLDLPSQVKLVEEAGETSDLESP